MPALKKQDAFKSVKSVVLNNYVLSLEKAYSDLAKDIPTAIPTDTGKLIELHIQLDRQIKDLENFRFPSKPTNEDIKQALVDWYNKNMSEYNMTLQSLEQTRNNIINSTKENYIKSVEDVKIYITGQHELIERLVAEFGISQLNVYKHLQPLLFVTTSATDNYNILSECVRDINVENAVKNLENQLENLEGSYKELKTSILVTAKQLEMLPEYDVEKENKFIDKASDIINLLRIVSAIPIIDELKLYKVLPDVNIVDIRLPKIQAIKIPKEIPEYSTFPEIPKISPLSISWYKELESVRNSVCPVCGRRLL